MLLQLYTSDRLLVEYVQRCVLPGPTNWWASCLVAAEWERRLISWCLEDEAVHSEREREEVSSVDGVRVPIQKCSLFLSLSLSLRAQRIVRWLQEEEPEQAVNQPWREKCRVLSEVFEEDRTTCWLRKSACVAGFSTTILNYTPALMTFVVKKRR